MAVHAALLACWCQANLGEVGTTEDKKVTTKEEDGGEDEEMEEAETSGAGELSRVKDLSWHWRRPGAPTVRLPWRSRD
jgi:hypothetical protein